MRTKRHIVRWNSITVQVWVMVFLCAAIVAGLVTLNMRSDLERERSVVLSTLKHRGEITAQSVSTTLQPTGQVVELLGNLAGTTAVTAGASVSCNVALGALQGIAGAWGYVAVVDRAGIVRCAAGKFAAHVGESVLASLPAVRRLVNSAVPATEGPFQDPILGELAVATGVPVPGTSTSTLMLVLSTQRTLTPSEPSTVLTTDVVDARTGLVMMHDPAQEGVVGKTAAQIGLGSVDGRSDGLVAAEGPNGKRLYAVTTVPGTSFLVLVGESQDLAYAPARESTRRNGVLGGGLVLVVAAMGLLLQRGVARPARALRQAMISLASDPKAAPAPTSGPWELAAVASAFNDTAAARRRADGLTRALVEHATDLLLVVDTHGAVSYVAPAAATMLGAKIGDNPLQLARLVHLSDRERLLRSVRQWLGSGARELRTELRVRDQQGEVHHLDVHAQDLRGDPDVGGIVLAARDDTERKKVEESLAFRARHDPLTGLANRSRVLEELRSCLVDATEEAVAVLFVDLDRFKLINDSHGHAVGDQVLVVLADRLFRLAGDGDLVGRLGGDEFVLVASSVHTSKEAMALADRIRGALDEPVTVAHRELFISGSVGVAMAEPGDNPSTVLRNADTAMYRAKDLGRNRATLFDEEMRAEAKRLLRTEVDLHRALERQELVVHYQPVLGLGATHGEVLGVEALVRWRHPTRGLVPPGEFIPVAEETGLVVTIGAWVLEKACAYGAANPDIGKVSVNVSPRQLAQPDVVATIRRVLEETGLSPERLCLEVTETLLVQDAAAAALTLQALHADGVQVAIDDFGTGWASLTYLQQFPVDSIKLDRSFVGRVTDDSSAAAIVAALIQLAHSMGLTVTAEGVETVQQADWLRANRCDTAQGFLYSKALSVPDLEEFMITRPRSVIPAPRADVSGVDLSA